MTEIIIPIITGIVCLAVGVVIGFLYRKSVAEKAIGDAETEATRIINEAIKAGEFYSSEDRKRETASGIRTEEGERAPAHQGRAGRKARTDREHDARRSTRNARQLDRGRGAA